MPKVTQNSPKHRQTLPQPPTYSLVSISPFPIPSPPLLHSLSLVMSSRRLVPAPVHPTTVANGQTPPTQEWCYLLPHTLGLSTSAKSPFFSPSTFFQPSPSPSLPRTCSSHHDTPLCSRPSQSPMVPSVSTLHPTASPPSALALKLNGEVMHQLRLLHKERKSAKLVVKNGQFVCFLLF